jgi:hypothetical protein
VARRKKQDAALGVGLFFLLIVGLPVWLLGKAADTVGSTVVIIGVAALIAAVIVLKARARAARRASLLLKYGDPSIVDAILQRKFWQGQTQTQLVDSIGRPAAVDNQFLKTKKREVWKYHQTGRNRYKLRLTLENDIVTGWDQKA